MKAFISQKGTLCVTPENETEAFALSQWDSEKHCLMLVKSFPVTEPITGYVVDLK